MKKPVNLHQAKTHLSELVDRAAAGEEIVIAKSGRPLAKLVPLRVPPSRRQRTPGDWRGKVWIAPDFDEPLDLADFEKASTKTRNESATNALEGEPESR